MALISASGRQIVQTILLCVLLMAFVSPSFGVFTVEDRKLDQAFVKLNYKTNSAIRSLRTVEHYRDPAKTKPVADNLSRMKEIIDKLSDPEDKRSKELAQVYQTLADAFSTNLEKAGVDPETLESRDGSVDGMTKADAIAAYNRDAKAVAEEIRAMKTLNDYGDANKLTSVQSKMKAIEKYIAIVKPSDASTAEKMQAYLNQIDEVVSDNLAKAKQAGLIKVDDAELPSSARPMSARDATAMRFFKKDYQRFVESFEKIDPVNLQNPDELAIFESRITTLKARLAKVQVAAHPEVIDGNKKIESLQVKLDEAVVNSKALVEKIGDFDEKMSELRKLYATGSFQSGLNSEAESLESIEAWGRAEAEKRDRHPKAVEFLRAAPSFTYKARNQDFDRFSRWVQIDVMPRNKQDINRKLERWNADAYQGLNPPKVEEEFLSQDDNANDYLQNIAEAREAMSKRAAFERGYLGDSSEETKANFAKLDESEKLIRKLQEAGLANARMPKAKSADPELVEIAEDLLAQPRLGFGKYKRLVVNADKKRYEKTEVYELVGFKVIWDQFQVAIAELDEDTGEYWIRYVTIKYVYEGSPRYPLKRWYTGENFRVRRILEVNIDK